MNLDISTVLVLFILNNLLIASLLAVSFRGRRTPTTDMWIISLVMQTVAWTLFAARGRIPDPISIVAAAGMLSLSYAILTDAFCEFFEFPVRRHWIYLPVFFTLAAFWWNLDNQANRNIASGLIFGAQMLATAAMILTRQDKMRALRIFIGTCAVITAAMFFTRAAITFHDPAAIPAVNVNSRFQTWSFLLGDAARLAFSFGFLLLLEARRSDDLTRLAALDPLTEAYNRRTFTELAERELARARRYRQPLGLMIMDLDHFKQVNDTHGHLAGDAVLRQVKKIAECCLRQQDVFGRYGGEEFCVLVPDTDLSGTQTMAERLRQGIENCALSLPDKELLRITASIGVSAIPVGADEVKLNNLFEFADLALYEAKKQGRNRVVAESLPPPHNNRLEFLNQRQGIALALHFHAVEKAHAEQGHLHRRFAHRRLHLVHCDVTHFHAIQRDAVGRNHTIGGRHHAALAFLVVDAEAARLRRAQGNVAGAGVHQETGGGAVDAAHRDEMSPSVGT